MRVNNALDIDIPVFTQYIKPALAAAGACLVARLGQSHIWYGISYKIGVMLTLITAVSVYLFLVLEMKCIRKEDMRL